MPKRSLLNLEKIAIPSFVEDSSNDAKQLDFLIENCLTARQKQIIVLYYYQKQTLRQIADTLGITESTVCRTKKRACKRLSHYLYHTRRELSNHEDTDL